MCLCLCVCSVHTCTYLSTGLHILFAHNFLSRIHSHALVAQLVEHLPGKQDFMCSNPTWSSSFFFKRWVVSGDVVLFVIYFMYVYTHIVNVLMYTYMLNSATSCNWVLYLAYSTNFLCRETVAKVTSSPSNVEWNYVLIASYMSLITRKYHLLHVYII